MAAAVCRIGYWNGASPVFTGASDSGVSAEGGVKFNREDTLTGTTPVPIPTSTGTNFSWLKNLGLEVTTTGTTSISNRLIYFASAPTTGLNGFYKGVASGSYAQAASGNMPAASGSNGATPATYTVLATSQGGASAYDASSVASSTQGLNGQLAVLVASVDNTYTGGAGSAIGLPTIDLTYTEQ